MFFERTSVGLDVHARSTTAWALDGTTGEVCQRPPRRQHGGCRGLGPPSAPACRGRLRGRTDWLRPGTCPATGWYPLRGGGAVENGTAGRGPGQDRQARSPAARQLLRLDELPAVRVPDLEQEAARTSPGPATMSAPT